MLQELQAENTASFSRDEVELLAIPPEGIEHVWPVARSQLALACSWTRKADLDVLRERLLDGFGQLWVIWVPGQKMSLATCVTEIEIADSGWKTARVVLLGGGRLEMWRHLMTDMEDWAKSESCDAIEIVGRPGWRRVFPEYQHCETVIAKEL